MVYNISYKTLIGSKPFRIRFDKIFIDKGFVRVYDGSRYLVLFGLEKYDVTCNRIRYLINLKSNITYVFSYYNAKIKVDSYDSLPLEKISTFHNVIKLTNSVFDKDQNHYYHNIFLEKCSYQLA